jgi:hypothetical protein
MTTQAIIESGMTFGPYPSGQCFYIEKSACYRGIQEGVQMAEFLLLRQQKDKTPVVWVVEAKSSCPRELTSYIDEIRIKLTNGFLLGLAACLKRHATAQAELPESFKELDIQSASFRFVLVIKGVPEFHLEVLQSALALALKPLVKTWALPPTSVMVLNDALAQQHGLILPVAGAVG